MPASREAIAVALGEGSPWSDGVKSLIKWQFGIAGDFKQALWRAIATADEGNLSRLERGFPGEVQAFRQWSQGNLASDLRKAGLEL